jgi:hypothetical protein
MAEDPCERRFYFGGSVAEHILAELRDRYLARSSFFWRHARDARFKEWQRMARTGAWKNLTWDWPTLGISETARDAADRLEFVPSEIFVHPEILSANPELLDYYRLLACLPRKGLHQLIPGKRKADLLELAQLLNRILSALLTMTAKASRESLLNTIFAEAGTEWQGTWVNSIGLRAAHAVEQILSNFAADKGLLDVAASAKLNDTLNGIALKSGTTLRFGSEPDVECRDPSGVLVCVMEIKGSADKAGAQTRLGETKKSFTKAKRENARCHTIFLPSVLTPAVQAQLKTERDIDQVFDLLEILNDEKKREEFLTEFFKFRLRERI